MEVLELFYDSESGTVFYRILGNLCAESIVISLNIVLQGSTLLMLL